MAIETNGGTWVNVNSNDDKGHVNVYGSDPKKTSWWINTR